MGRPRRFRPFDEDGARSLRGSNGIWDRRSRRRWTHSQCYHAWGIVRELTTYGVRGVAGVRCPYACACLDSNRWCPSDPCISDTEKGPPQPPPRGGEGWRRPTVALLSPGIVVEGEVPTPDILGFWSAPHGAAAKRVRLTAWGNYPFSLRLTASARNPFASRRPA